MEYRPLGRTDLKVSAICLGTMNWGEQNTEQEAHEQLDYALDAGINFIGHGGALSGPAQGRNARENRILYRNLVKGVRQPRQSDPRLQGDGTFGHGVVSWWRDKT